MFRILFPSFLRSTSQIIYRQKCSNRKNFDKLKITVCGADGRLGQIVSLFLKTSNYTFDLALHDISPHLSDFNQQISSLNTMTNVNCFIGPLRLRSALKNSDIVLILVNYKYKAKALPMDLFKQNFPIVANIAKCCAEVSPQAILAIASSPINLLVPAIDKVYKSLDKWYENKILGITAFDSMQACTIYADTYSLDRSDVFVPIVGGTTEDTVLPLFSQSRPPPHKNFNREENEYLLNKFLDMKNRETYSELAAGFAVARFTESLIRAICGEKDIVECSFVPTSGHPNFGYMSSLIELGEDGVTNIFSLPNNLSRFEKKLLSTAFGNLERDINFVDKYLISPEYHLSQLN